MAKQRMNIEQYVEVTDWLKENKFRIEANEYTQLETATLAEDVLGYSVPITTVQRCAKIAKVKWAKSPVPPPPVPIEREAIIILIGALAGLYVETGRTLPAELANLKSTYVRKQEEDENAGLKPLVDKGNIKCVEQDNKCVEQDKKYYNFRAGR